MRTWCGAILAAAVALGVDAGELKPGEVVSGFAVRSVTPLPEAGGRLVRMTYEKNGADLAWLDRDDDNKTFAIAFRTIPGDDTGVAHIIEHSVLCGSEKYPVKEPFVEMLKSSFSTYLNAWTGSDCTAYPVCSRNGADFLNLMDVYLDAVFHPLSVKSPLAFRQEGWHYEFKDGELVRNGVVLNEMRGCYGSPDRLAWHMLGRLLFPGNCYGRESGGDPAQIHELTWGKYRAFYRRHYHPSNARIFLDGRIDLAATLARLDAVLSAYPRAEISSPNPVQRPVRAEKTAEYEIGAEESAADKTLYLEGWVFGTFRDRETQMGLEVLADALADSNEAPLKKALLSKGLCENVSFDVDCDEQISVRLCAKNVKDGKSDEVRRVVRETLESIARDGVDKARLGALIDRREFRYREMDYGGFPRGLVFFRRALGQWLYGGDPADALRSGHVYSGLRAKAKTGWFEDLLRMAVIDNPHNATLALVPSKAIGEERRRAEKAELAAVQAKWTPEERERVMAECRALDEFQKRVDSPEDLSKLPRLSLGDIPEDGPVPEYSETSVGGVRVIRAKTSANGIAYLKLYFELAGCTGEDLSDASALSDVLGDLPTAKRGVMELKNALDAGLGRFQTSTQTFAKPGDSKHAKAYFVVSVSALDAKLGEIARLVPEVLLESSFADANLVGDIVKQRRRGIEETLMGVYGSGFASRRALASQSVQGAMEEHFGGIAFLRRLQRIDDGFAADGAAYCRRLEALSRRVFVRAGLTACLSDNVPTEWLGGLFGRFPEGGAAEPSQIQAFAPVREGFRTAGKVGAAAKASFPDAYSGSGCVAANMLTLDYLWNEIRVQGGAYGGGFAVRPGGEARYNSWNDPKPARSLGVYDGSGDALRRLVQDSSSIDSYIISAVSATEPYLSPSVETSRAAELVLSERTPGDLRRVRREMLRTTKGDILRFAGVLDSITNSTSVCVVGGAAQVEACSNLLDRVESVARE